MWSLWDWLLSESKWPLLPNPFSSGFLGLMLAVQHCRLVRIFEYVPSMRLTKKCHYSTRKRISGVRSGIGIYWRPKSWWLSLWTKETKRRCSLRGMWRFRGTIALSVPSYPKTHKIMIKPTFCILRACVHFVIGFSWKANGPTPQSVILQIPGTHVGCPALLSNTYLWVSDWLKKCHYYDEEENFGCTIRDWHPLAAQKLMANTLKKGDRNEVFAQGYVTIPGYHSVKCPKLPKDSQDNDKKWWFVITLLPVIKIHVIIEIISHWMVVWSGKPK